MTKHPTPSESRQTPDLVVIGTPGTGLTIHAVLPGEIGQSDPLAKVLIQEHASAQDFAMRIVTACNNHASSLARIEALERALEQIARWDGFPETGQFYDRSEKRPVSYGAAFGSNGERDYMRSVARHALAPAAGKGGK